MNNHTNMDQLDFDLTPEPMVPALFKYALLTIPLSIFWQWKLGLSSVAWDASKEVMFHFFPTAISSLLIALLVYLANNFWFPKWFGKPKK